MSVERGAELSGRRTIRADAVVIGTGAGGAPVAKELAEGGMRVVMLEEGEHHTTDAMNARPRDMAARLYRDAGQSVTAGNVPIMLPLGRSVGGTTLVNSGTCFRAPDRVLESWRREFGLDALSPEALDPFASRVEELIGVAQVPPELAGRNAAVVKRGADALGWSVDYLHRNARGCVGSGVCAFGCPTSAKQHTGLVYVPRAWAAGAVTWTGCRARRIEVERGRARAVEARSAGGGRLRVEADHVIVACGAIHTPLLLRPQPDRPRARASWARTSRSIPPPPCARCSTRRSTCRAACRSRSTSTSSPTRASCSRAPPGRPTTSR